VDRRVHRPGKGRLYVTASHIGWGSRCFAMTIHLTTAMRPKTAGQKVYEKRVPSAIGNDRLGVGIAPPLRGLRHRMTDDTVVRQIRNGKNPCPPIRL